MDSNFFRIAVRPTSRRAGTTDELSGCDRRTAGTGNEAKRERDMREYPFWARGADYIEIMRFAAPRKILRDSPAALPLAQKKMLRHDVRLVFGLVVFCGKMNRHAFAEISRG